jgi:hypothetical protein
VRRVESQLVPVERQFIFVRFGLHLCARPGKAFGAGGTPKLVAKWLFGDD